MTRVNFTYFPNTFCPFPPHKTNNFLSMPFFLAEAFRICSLNRWYHYSTHRCIRKIMNFIQPLILSAHILYSQHRGTRPCSIYSIPVTGLLSTQIVHGANMGSIWVLPAPDGPHVGPMNLAIGYGWTRSQPMSEHITYATLHSLAEIMDCLIIHNNHKSVA